MIRIINCYKSSMHSILFLLTCIFSLVANAAELSNPYVSKDACPFEGCKYGMWPVKKNTPVYSEPNKKSNVIATLLAGTSATALTGDVDVIPGEAKIIGKPSKYGNELDRNKIVFILETIGEGYTRIYQDGKFYSVKFGSKHDCNFRFDKYYCWLDVTKEPVTFWWVKVQISDKTGWVLIENENIQPIDEFS